MDTVNAGKQHLWYLQIWTLVQFKSSLIWICCVYIMLYIYIFLYPLTHSIPSMNLGLFRGRCTRIHYLGFVCKWNEFRKVTCGLGNRWLLRGRERSKPWSFCLVLGSSSGSHVHVIGECSVTEWYRQPFKVSRNPLMMETFRYKSVTIQSTCPLAAAFLSLCCYELPVCVYLLSLHSMMAIFKMVY